MELNNNIETLIFMQNREIVKVVMNFKEKTCIVYSSKEQILLRLEKMSTISMLMLRGQIIKYIADGKKLRGFTPYRGMGYL